MVRKPRDLPRIGWREWVALPALGVQWINAKVDTGARSSALHAFDLEIETVDDIEIVRFLIHPLQRDFKTTIAAEAKVVEWRTVRSSSGHVERRPVVSTDIELLGARFPIELSLTRRDEMGFRMLLGREAVRGRFLVDPGRSFYNGRPTRARRVN